MPAKKKAKKPAKRGKKKAAAKKKKRKPAAPAQPDPAPATTDELPVPDWGTHSPPYSYCGAHTQDGSSYCPEHHAMTHYRSRS